MTKESGKLLWTSWDCKCKRWAQWGKLRGGGGHKTKVATWCGRYDKVG